MRPYKPHPFGDAAPSRSDGIQSIAWRARRDACRPAEEIAAMSPIRRERALAVRAAARGMLTDPTTTPCGQIAALRVGLAVPPGGDLTDDWAERHRLRERERMRRRQEAGDPKLAAARQRARQKAKTPEGRAKRARQEAAKRAWQAEARQRAEAESNIEGKMTPGQAAALAEIKTVMAEVEAIMAQRGLPLPPG